MKKRLFNKDEIKMKFDKETAAYKKKRVVYLENKKDIW
jgi:hypothetical protein